MESTLENYMDSIEPGSCFGGYDASAKECNAKTCFVAGQCEKVRKVRGENAIKESMDELTEKVSYHIHEKYIKWTLEACKKDALKYKYRGDWQELSNSGYTSAARKGWLDECCSHMPSKIKWTLEACKEDALKYKSRSEWQRSSGSGYQISYAKGWLDECCSHMKRKTKYMKRKDKWALEACKKDALKYKHKQEWKNNSSSVYRRAHGKGWLDECCSHMKRKIKWPLEDCKKDALKYKTRGEWSKAPNSAYSSAYSKGWTDECCSHMERKIKWTLEACKENALKYKTRGEWDSAPNSGYMKAHVKGWLEECCLHMPKSKWTLEECKEDALAYGTKREWRNLSSRAYSKASKSGWMGECCTHMRSGPRWTLEDCKEDALNYKTRGEWQIVTNSTSKRTYATAHSQGWLEECCAHMPKPRLRNKWTLEACKENALRYNSRGEWNKKSQSAYNKANNEGWLDKCCSYMPKKMESNKNVKWTIETCKEDALKYKARGEWSRLSGSAYRRAHGKGWLEECCLHMPRNKSANNISPVKIKKEKRKYTKKNEENIVMEDGRIIMTESWEKDICEKCNTANYYYIGDIQDVTLPDIDGTECYKCGHRDEISYCNDRDYEPEYELGREVPMGK